MNRCIVIGVVLICGCGSESGIESGIESGVERKIDGQVERRSVGSSNLGLSIEVYDDTTEKPIHKEAELVAGSGESVWLKKVMSGGKYRGQIVTAPPYFPSEILIYPDTRSGREIRVPVLMTREMAPTAEPPAILIEITDHNVTASGDAVANRSESLLTMDRF